MNLEKTRLAIASRRFAALAIAFYFPGCGSADFQGATSKQDAGLSGADVEVDASIAPTPTSPAPAITAPVPTVKPTLAPTKAASNPTETPSPTSTPVPEMSPTSVGPCPFHKENILIIDLKSGWWTEYGGTFIDTAFSQAIAPCQQLISVRYDHLGQGSSTTFAVDDLHRAFPDTSSNAYFPVQDIRGLFSDLKSYTQIWLLSGTNSDNVDTPADSPAMAYLMKLIKESGANLLIAGGAYATSHANLLTATLGLGNVFDEDPTNTVQEWRYHISTSGVTEQSALSIIPTQKNHLLFSRNVDAVADSIALADFPLAIMDSNSLQPTTPGLQVIANNSRGQPVLAVIASEEHRLVFDAGFQRYYDILGPNPSPDTLKLLQNIAAYLGHW